MLRVNLFSDIISNPYDIKRLEKFYNEYYFKNILNMPYEKLWMKIKDIPDSSLDAWHVLGDEYLRESFGDKLSLGRDIIENGTFWPLFLTRDRGKGLDIRDGSHRIYSLKQLEKLGEISGDKEFLVIIDEAKKTGDDNYYFPASHIIHKDLMNLYHDVYEMISSKMSTGDFKFADDTAEVLMIEDDSQSYKSQMIFSILLRNSFFEYEKRSGKKIKPIEAINSKRIWEEEVFKYENR